jgi:flagellar assembly protein FliH
MPGNEKFMFDTIFDELEPIEPEIAEDELHRTEDGEALLEEEPEEEIVPTFSEAEVNAARQEGLSSGKEQGVSETLAGIEKSTSDTFQKIADNISRLFTTQEKVNTELTEDATALSLAIVSKYFPTLNEESALNEVILTVKILLGRLIDEPKILIKANPALSDNLAEKLDQLLADNNITGNLTILADEGVNLGDCKIEWSNGSAERNLTALMGEIDDIIAQNSITTERSSSATTGPDVTTPETLGEEETESTENIADLPQNSEDIPNSEAAFEQSVKDDDLELKSSSSEEIIDDGAEKEVTIESNEENDDIVTSEDNDTP